MESGHFLHDSLSSISVHSIYRTMNRRTKFFHCHFPSWCTDEGYFDLTLYLNEHKSRSNAAETLKLNMFIVDSMISWYMNISGIFRIKLSLTKIAWVHKTVWEMYTFDMVENIHSLTVLSATHSAHIHRLSFFSDGLFDTLIQNITVISCNYF